LDGTAKSVELATEPVVGRPSHEIASTGSGSSKRSVRGSHRLCCTRLGLGSTWAFLFWIDHSKERRENPQRLILIQIPASIFLLHNDYCPTRRVLLTGSPALKPKYTLQLSKKLAISVVLSLLTFSLIGTQILVGAADLSDKEEYVHDFFNTPPYGNWTLIEKPMFPLYFNQSQIPIGSNWTVISPLAANHTYHAYFYGKWIDRGSTPKTDYDIYVYNPLGELENYRTESAGLPEHLGTTVDRPFFVPRYSGNYSFVLRNDPKESNASQQATFMLIENLETNKWQKTYIEGKQNDTPIFNTSRAFEFATESQHIEVWIRVPETLDMYEARLYLMANPKAGMGETLNDLPLAWEPGLYGEIRQPYGGYNLESKEYRGNAYASCEFYGQDMLMNYTSPVKSKSLYHLAFIGEKGSGKIDFLVKTEFGKAALRPVDLPSRVYPNNETALTFASNSTDLKYAALDYSVYNWANYTALNMHLTNNRTCTTKIPGQAAGTTVEYKVQATDVLENILTYNGSYTVKYGSQLNITLKTKAIPIGDNITLTGLTTPPNENLAINLVFTSTNTTFEQIVYTQNNGTFTASFRPTTQGNWIVQAVFGGNNMLYESSTTPIRFKVDPPPFLTLYGAYIYAGAGIGAGTTVMALVYIKKRRE